MYDLMRKHSKQKAASQPSDHVPTQLLNLIEEGTRREQQYLKIIENLRQEKQEQAKQYITKLEEFSKHLEEFRNKKDDERERRQFQSFELRRQEEAKRRSKRAYGKKEYTIEDINKFALEIELKFLFFMPTVDDPLSSHYPKRLEIKFESLGLNFNSGKVSYAHSESEYHQMLLEGSPFVLESASPTKKVCYTLSLQITETRTRSKLQQLIQSIKKGLLEIEVWDYDSKILHGLSYISLEQLLFYDKGEDYWTQQADVFSPLRNGNVGKLDIQFRNYKSPVVENTTIVVDTANSSNQKLKVTSTTPFQPDIQQDIKSIEEKEMRMMRRINHAKEESMKLGKSVNMSLQFDQLSNQMSQRRLEHIMKLKESNKFNQSEKVLSKMQHQYQSYECNLGNPLIISFEFTNNYDESMTFQLIPSEHLKQMKHVSIITNPDDLQFYRKEFKLVGQPPSIDPKTLRLTLFPSQHVYILMKYLTWVYVADKPMEIHVANANNNDVVQTFVFRVKAVPEVVDHKFRIFEGEGVTTQLNIPFNESSEYFEPYLHCADNRLAFAWAADRFALKLRVTTNQQIAAYIYDCKDCRKLLKCYQIIVKSFTLCQFKNLQIGLEKTIKLEIPPFKQATEVKLFSSDSQRLWTHANRSLKIKPDTIQTVSVTGRTFAPGNQSIILSCNKLSGEVVCQWLFKFRVSKPVFRSSIQIIASTKKKTAYSFQLLNPTNKTEAFGMVSSNLSYVQIPDNKKVLNGGKIAFISLAVLPHQESEKEVVLNVSNSDQSYNQNYLLQLKFTDKYREKQETVEQIVYRRY